MQPGDTDERDGLMNGPARRRGAGLNPGNRFEKVRLHVLGDERERQRLERRGRRRRRRGREPSRHH